MICGVTNLNTCMIIRGSQAQPVTSNV
uniref:Uncharacterized protein n=1 Tax=Arundo donax TaxID=35708 RepID=A0A0A9H6H5_ARUDO